MIKCANLHCGMEFKPNRTKKFCDICISEKANKTAKAGRRKSKDKELRNSRRKAKADKDNLKIIVACAHCKTEFATTRRNDGEMCCSDECTIIHYNTRLKKERRTCSEDRCENTFLVQKRSKITICPECRKLGGQDGSRSREES